ncbi:MAG: UvrD-helicase domain-containing protein [bacterium]|nr:UvrD-helicase domain-containing protein [bacterium]
MIDLLTGLNERQQQAVTVGDGAVLVLAGPGSGKTRVLTHRIAHLLYNQHISPENIMSVTFTNKAAGEMKERLNKLLGGRVGGLQIGTFHSICARLLRREGDHTRYGHDFNIFDTDDQMTVIRQAVREASIDTKKFSPDRLRYAISAAKNDLITPADYTPLDYFGEMVGRVYPRYQSALQDNNAMDFDDLLMQMVLLLRNNVEVRQKYERRVVHLLVDEFQDTNTAQYALVGLLGNPQNNIFVVGDEDQAIYGFRGADYRNVAQFRKDYPDAVQIILDQNYRSTQRVLDVARALIEKNPHRTPKLLFTDRKGGRKVIIQETYSEAFEAQYVLEQIESLRQKANLAWSDFAIMYRTNAQSRAFEEACIREGLPYRLVGGVGFYKRREVKDLIAYLRVVNSSTDRISLERIINTPKRAIGDKSFQNFMEWVQNECDNSLQRGYDRLLAHDFGTLPPKTARLIGDFVALIAKWRKIATQGKLTELFDTITTDIHFSLYLHEISEDKRQEQERQENVQELRGLLVKAQAEDLSLSDFLGDLALVADVEGETRDRDAVTLLTLHAAKGLEFPAVFLTGVEEGLLPHSRAFDEPDGLAEERRLMYVGITRAKDYLYLTHAFRRTIFGSNQTTIPSQFLFDLPGDDIEGISPMTEHMLLDRKVRQQSVWDVSPMPKPSTPPKVTTPDTPRQMGIRAKITPFSETQETNKPQTRFNSGDRVLHGKFGRGSVLLSKKEGEVEEVTVAFDDRRFAIKTVEAEYLQGG